MYHLTLISSVPDQNGVSQAWYRDTPFWSGILDMLMCTTHTTKQKPLSQILNNNPWLSFTCCPGHAVSKYLASTKTACDYLNGWIKKRSHTQKSHSKAVNPRDIAGERKREKEKKISCCIFKRNLKFFSKHSTQLMEKEERRRRCLFVGWLLNIPATSYSVSQGRNCSDNFTCCHTEIQVADQTFYLTQSQYTDTGPTSPSADPIMPGAWQGSHWSANF